MIKKCRGVTDEPVRISTIYNTICDCNFSTFHTVSHITMKFF